MQDTTPTTEAAAPARRSARPLVVGLGAIVLLVVLFRTLPVEEWLAAFQAYVAGLGPAGYAIYAAGYAACVVLFVPASVLTLGAGALYGVWTGVAVVLVGATVGATLAFLLARGLARRRVEHMIQGNPRFRALDRAIAREGARIVFLVRLAPVFPFTYINYAFGLTGVPASSYVVASLFGMIPGTFAYVYLGAAAAGLVSGEADSTARLLQIAGALAALAVTVLVARLATRAIRSAGVEDAAEDPAATPAPR